MNRRKIRGEKHIEKIRRTSNQDNTFMAIDDTTIGIIQKTLVIIIISLLILVGISTSYVFQNNDTINMSKQVVNKTTLASQKNTFKMQISNFNQQEEKLIAKQAIGTAKPEHVLAGQTFSNANGIGLNGTMPNKGNLNFNPSNSTSYTVQPGYYSGGTLSSANAYNGGYKAGKNDSKIYYGDGKVIWQAYIEGTKPVFGLEMPSDCVQVVAVTFKYGGNTYGVGLDDQVWDYNINNSYRDTTLKDTLKESKNLAIKKPGTANATDVKVFYLKTKQF